MLKDIRLSLCVLNDYYISSLTSLQDAGEKLNEKLSAREFGKRRELSMEFHRDSDSQHADESYSHVLSEHRPIKSILEEIPKPKFSTRSPSSPAKLSSLPKASSPLKPRQQLFVSNIPIPQSHLDGNPPNVNGIDDDLAQPLGDGSHDIAPVDVVLCVPDYTVDQTVPGHVVLAVPGLVDRVHVAPTTEEEAETSDGSDTEPQPHHLLKRDLVKQKLLALKLEDRGIADGESPRQYLSEERLRETPTQSLEQDNSNLASAVSSSSRPAPTKAGPMISLPYCNSVDAEQLHVNMTRMAVENSIDVYRTKDTVNGQDKSGSVEEGFYLHQEHSPDWMHELPLNGHLKSSENHKGGPRKSVLPSSSNMHKDSKESTTRVNHSGARPKTLELENSYDSSSRSTSESSGPRRRPTRNKDTRLESDCRSLCLGPGQAEDYSLVRASIDVLMNDEHLPKPDQRGRCKPPRPPRGSRPVLVASTAR